MKNVIITGANGMIGNLVLQNCLQSNDIKQVITITRKPLNIHHAKLITILHDNFSDFSSIENHFQNIDVAFYCLGVYTGKVNALEFKNITVAYTKAFAETLLKNSKESSFCFLSGAGADSSEKSKILFAREKGIAENILLNLGFKAIYIFRPGYIYPVTPRKEPNIGYTVMRILYKPVSFLYPNIGIKSNQLANKIFTTGLFGGDKTIYENEDIRG